MSNWVFIKDSFLVGKLG